LNLCDRIALLDEGRVALDLPAYRLNALADGIEGFTISVYGLPPGLVPVLQRHPGIRDVRIASQRAGEQTLEVWTAGGDAVLAGFIAELTGLGATIASLQRSTPLQGVLERLAVRGSHSDIRDEVAV
jgi:hypothetical protein